MNISIIIPLLNEQDSLKELANSIDQVLNAYSLSYEIILIDDGSNDGSWKIIEELTNENSFIKGIRFQISCGNIFI